MSSRLDNNTSTAMPKSSLRVLVADDDPASQRFLCDALRGLGTEVQACGDGLSAMGHAREECFDVLLLDCRMPSAGALEILQSVRGDNQARSSDSVAVATTAELSSRERQSLLAAGFSDILLKPCTVDDLRSLLGLSDNDREPVLDDASALSTSGNVVTMQALRKLLRDELSQLQRELDTLSHNHDDFSERLHRLRSSCGFCGAAALAVQAASLQRQLDRHSMTAGTLAAFRLTLQKTLRALQG